MSAREPRVETLTDPPDPDLIEEVATRLLEGGIAVLPTDTVYGLCAAVESEAGLARVFEIKGRDQTKAIPIFIGDLSQARSVAKFNAEAERLVTAFWPGALTLVLERRHGITWDLGGDPETVGIRWPESRFLSELCLRAGPITGTSANLTGVPESKTVGEAVSAFGDTVDVYVDGGPSAGAIPSTIVRLTGAPEVLRAGAIPASEILALLQ